MTTPRRNFLAGAGFTLGAAGLPPWLAAPLLAQAAIPRRRLSATSSSTDATSTMQAYRRAVAAMKQRPRHDPTGWYWQSNIHGFPGGQAEFDATFPQGGIPGVTESERARLRSLALQTWGQCPHGGPFFLPWHRVYLYFFERIVQAASGVNDFALPYWDWTLDRQLPRAFREAVNGQQSGNALFHAMRGNNFNGDAAGENAGGMQEAEVDVAMLSQPRLDSRLDGQAGNAFGFGPELEGGPHGQVHVAVSGDMGTIARSARDPVFWTHHCNIDRLWERWSGMPGHANPVAAQQWLERQHTFVDRDGQPRTLSTQQVLATAAILDRGYVYVTEEMVASAPTGGVVVPASSPGDGSGSGGGTPAAPPQVGLPASAGNAPGVALGNGRTDLNLKLDKPEVAVPAGAQRLYIAIKDLDADRPPGDNFAIYINLPAGAQVDPRGRHFAGVINFFGALKSDKVAVPAGGHSGHGSHPTQIDRLIDVTEALSKLRSQGLWDGGNLNITIVPVRGNVDASAQVRIGGIELIRR